ncbi:MAG: serine/threonine protein kinase [Verrucomicrobia bacterium]|nr:serine/threonine protein kinase [Verrucomicrobiota bacterium]
MDRSLDDSTRAWFDRLDALPAHERPAALALIPDPTTRAEVESLLQALDGRDGFLESPLMAAAPAVTGTTLAEGRRIGPWRVLRLLGEGGMGAVWLGERADGRFERQVALKFLRGTVFSGLAAERFREEVSILGALDHPGIARLLDAGSTEDGSAYLVTEFVDGETLDVWRQRVRPPLRERLRVFAELCAAVSFAHRALVVHRDLKPGNVLIARDGAAKLLDFGLARLLSPGGGAARDLSLLRAFTPAYASPEQIEGQPVSTATDVFSLGVLLYELCADRHPFRRECDEVATLAAVLREEPALPSRVTGNAALRGDLDTIVLRALEKTPTRRYADARELGEDIARHLENRPIRARPASLGYRAGKWIRRQPIVAGAAAAVLLAVAGGLTLSQLQRTRALRGEAEAVRQRDLARDMALVMVDELGANLARMTGPTEARVRLLEKAAEALALAAPSQAERARAEWQLARAYRGLGRLDEALRHAQAGRSTPGAAPLVAASLASLEGEVLAARFRRAAAVEAFRAAERALDGVAAGQMRDLPEAQAWLNVRANVALLTANAGKFAEAGKLYAEALAPAREWLARWPKDAELLRLAGKAAAGLSNVALSENRREVARATKEEALRWLRQAVELAPNDPGVRQTFANVLGFLAVRDFASPNDRAGALAALREARDEKRRLLQADPSNVVFAFEFLGTCGDLGAQERQVGEAAAGRATLEEAIAVVRRFAAAGVSEQRLASAAAGCLTSLAFWHIGAGETAPAIAAVQEAVPILEESLRRDYSNSVARGLLADALSLLGELQGGTEQYRAAEESYWKALWWRRNEVRESGLPAHSAWLAQTLLGYGEMLAKAGRREESAGVWREALALLEGLHARGLLPEDSEPWTKERPKLLEYLKTSS